MQKNSTLNYNSRRIKLAFAIMILFLIFSIGINLVSGSVSVTLKDYIEALTGQRELSTMEYNILFKIRLPRIISAILFGAALSVSGFLLQTFFKNPISGPFVLGISSGARLFVGFVVLTNVALNLRISSLLLLFLASTAGSLLSMLLVLLFARRINNISILIVIGIMIGYIASAGTNFMIAFASEHKIASLTTWSMGSFSGVNWRMLFISTCVIVPVIFLTYIVSKPLEAYLLGENYAKSMGVNIKQFRLVLIFLSSILSAVVTGFAGPISFVGIAVPHLTRLSLKTSKPKILIPAIVLMGSSFCLISDYFARTLFAPTELNISTITSFIGAPIVIYLMVGRKRGHA
ncbi:MAG: iron ABC transporter permease [Tissierellia bacterium]|nr:iron ABC transporter permease [Tissierellia bacterium]